MTAPRTPPTPPRPRRAGGTLAALAASAALLWTLAVPAPPAAAQSGGAGAGRYTLPFAVLQGAPDVRPGEGLGYWLWQDDAGLHLRTTGPGPRQRFAGAIRVRGGGRLLDVDRVRFEDGAVNDDRAVKGPDDQVILFGFDTFGGVDGVDFKLLGRSFCVELLANGGEAPGETRLGQAEVRPDRLPVCFDR